MFIFKKIKRWWDCWQGDRLENWMDNHPTMEQGFNWFYVLNKLKRGAIVQHDYLTRLGNMSDNWPTCACGQLCQSLPRTMSGNPSDRDLTNEGGNFCGFVAQQEWIAAEETMKSIEQRTAYLLQLQRCN